MRAATRRGGREQRGSGKSGLIEVDAGGQEVLERTAAVVTPDWVEVRLQLGLPAAGRRVLGRQAESMLCRNLPRIAEAGLCWSKLARDDARLILGTDPDLEGPRGAALRVLLYLFERDAAVKYLRSG